MKNLRLVPLFLVLLLSISLSSVAQSYRNNSTLELESIMKGYEWMGAPPGSPRWSPDGEEIYFTWNPDKELLDSEYRYSLESGEISKLSPEERQKSISPYSVIEDNGDADFLFIRNGNLYTSNRETKEESLILDLESSISSPFYSPDRQSLFFTHGNNLYKDSFKNGTISRFTNFVKDTARPEKKKWTNDQEEWLYNDQEELFDIIKQNNIKNELRKETMKLVEPEGPVAIPFGNSRVSGLGISGDESFVTFTLFTMSDQGKRTEMPRYVTETGFTEISKVRSKVGYSYGEMRMGVFDIKKDTFYYINETSLPGIYDYLIYGEEQKIETREEPKNIFFSEPVWSPERDKVIVNIRSLDNKDRWIASIDLESGSLKCLDHQRDDAWISGPGIGWSFSPGVLGWLDDNRTIYFQSEETGYSHLYLYDLNKDKKQALTRGNFEVYEPFLSRDKKSFYLTSNMEHSGEKQFYQLSIKNGKLVQLTETSGQHEVSLSPDEEKMIIRYSYATKPWELLLKTKYEDGSWSEAKEITSSYTSEFNSYKWKEPEFILVPASDGEKIPARIYKPEEEKSNGCGVIFVHGAGYLQNAHKGWSSYFREYMFHNFLVDNGYTVLDMDYRASAGYGRYWRTAIYRHMGGKDLSDNVDGARFLVDNEGVDKERIGIYGGSYGGFITLMAQFTAPGVFKAGAALRPVTDWAHYNHGYTANILNTPSEDSIAYKRSSPIYFASGLQDHLIMCHGMVDDNVHFQDVVRLSQRLIELQKDNWEVAMYPIEPHGFREWTSWLDEYKRIYKLFEETLNNK